MAMDKTKFLLGPQNAEHVQFFVVLECPKAAACVRRDKIDSSSMLKVIRHVQAALEAKECNVNNVHP